ncbi:MAG: AsmA-like C-terminal region-containing protein [Flavobacteriales bacterium]
MERVWRIVKKVGIGLLISVVVLFTTAFVIVRYYEDEVVSYALTKINDRLKTKANVGAVDLTFWDSFPKASLRFSDVYIEETFPEKDTLFFAQKLYLSFDLMDLFSGDYTIKKVSAEEAKAWMKINKKGEDNWHIFKEDASTDTSSFRLALENVELEETAIVYEDRASQFFIDIYTSTGEAGGSFQSERFDLELDLETKIHSLISGSDEYVENRRVRLESVLDADMVNSKFIISNGKVSIDDIPFVVGGYVITGEKSFVDLHVDGDDITLTNMLSILPEGKKVEMDDYAADGVVSFHAGIQGATGGGKVPDVNARFSIADGEMEHRESGVSMSAINLDGSYLRGTKTDQLKLNQFSASLEGGVIEGSGTIDQLSNPIADMRLKMDIGLRDLSQFFNWDTLEVCEGRIYAEAGFVGPLSSGAHGSEVWNNIKTTGKAELSDAHIKLRGSNRDFTGIASSISFNNKDAVVQRLHGQVNGSDFVINGALKNLIPFLTSTDQRLTVEATLNSQVIDFTQLVETAESTKSDREYSFSLPERIDFSLQTSVKKFLFGKFEASDVRGLATLRNKVFRIDPVSLNTCEGSFVTQVELAQQADNTFGLTCFANLKDINIQKLFYQFDNLGQTFITDQQLRGKATAAVEFKAPVTNSLEIVTDQIYSLVDISIANGELIGLGALQDIGIYIKNNKWIAPFVDEERFADRMKDVKFYQLENVIEIKNRKITVPKMDIRSSALDISVSGTHTFDNVIDYTIGFRLRDILVRKNANPEEMDDGLGKQMYIYMRGTTSEPEFGVDKEASKEIRKEEIAAEKQNMKALLKQEFGLFKNDGSVGTYQEKQEVKQSTTNVVWEENDTQEEKAAEEAPKPKIKQPETPTNTNATETKKGKKLPKWLQEKE